MFEDPETEGVIFGSSMPMTGSVTPFQYTYLARQAIYDANLAVYGYELLYRSGEPENSSPAGDEPPALTLTAELSDIGLDSIVGDVPVWVDLGDAILTHLPEVLVRKGPLPFYRGVPGLSNEASEKLGRVRPETLGQASRIPGITPAAIAGVHFNEP